MEQFAIVRRINGFSMYLFGKKVFSWHKKPSSRKYKQLESRKYEPDFSLADRMEMIALQFEVFTGYKLNLDNPQTFNEKLQWLKLFYHNPLMTLCADKHLVKEYVASIIGEEHLIPTIGVWDTPEQIDFAALPEAFVLKVNWGSGQNIIVRDKSKADIRAIQKKLAKWISPRGNLYFYSFEPGYRDITPKIICEPYIGALAERLTCYKIFTFASKPYLAQVVFDDKTRSTTINYYDLNWNKLDLRQNFPNNARVVPRPSCFGQMLEFAEKLANPFPHFLRVDMFEVGGQVLFSEITFFSDNGMAPFSPAHWDKQLGELIVLEGLEER